jgi:hypothetical protein
VGSPPRRPPPAFGYQRCLTAIWSGRASILASLDRSTAWRGPARSISRAAKVRRMTRDRNARPAGSALPQMSKVLLDRGAPDNQPWNSRDH